MARMAGPPDAYKIVVAVPVVDDDQREVARTMRGWLGKYSMEEWEVRSAGLYGVRATCFVPIERVEDNGTIAVALRAGRLAKAALDSTGFVYTGDVRIHATTWKRWGD